MHTLDFLSALDARQLGPAVAAMPASRAQLCQDLFALSETGFKRDGFFVEFGATDGIELSNTHLLETEFGWRGILAEPARSWHAALRRNRNATIETKCVWSRTGETLEFNETQIGEFSTLDQFSASDRHKRHRRAGTRYSVETISLLDMLDAHDAPKEIDFLSIDTEGSEFEILEAFDFDRYRFAVITCEHNFTPMREKIHALLTSNGYVRKNAKLSKFDDWYVYKR